MSKASLTDESGREYTPASPGYTASEAKPIEAAEREAAAASSGPPGVPGATPSPRSLRGLAFGSLALTVVASLLALRWARRFK